MKTKMTEGSRTLRGNWPNFCQILMVKLNILEKLLNYQINLFEEYLMSPLLK